MKKFQPTYKPYGNSAILIEWPSEISKEILNDIVLFVKKIHQKNIKQILDINFIYNSILVIYDYKDCTYEIIQDSLIKIYNESTVTIQSKRFLWEIPVCYHEDFGIDLQLLSASKKININEIIKLHTEAVYRVYGIGFLPGFLYLGGLFEKLHFPRQSTPRLLVPKGSVGIGGNQTGIYPQNSPGGWHIIGKTPISLFNAKSKKPCFINPNDEIKFVAIDKHLFFEIEDLCKNGNYFPKSIQLND